MVYQEKITFAELDDVYRCVLSGPRPTTIIERGLGRSSFIDFQR